MSACASVISIRAQGHVQWGKYREKKEVSLKKVIKGGENVCPYSKHGQQASEPRQFYSCCVPSELGGPHTSSKRWHLQAVPFSADSPGGEGWGRRRAWGAQTVVSSMTSLVKCRHSEKCFPLVAAICFLVWICTPWQGFVRGHNEQLYHPPPNCWSPCRKAVRMMQVWISPIRERGFQWL